MLRELVDGDPRIACVGLDARGATIASDPTSVDVAGAALDEGPLIETLRGLASLDRAAFERALRGLGFDRQPSLPIRSLRRVAPDPARAGRTREREAG